MSLSEILTSQHGGDSLESGQSTPNSVGEENPLIRRIQDKHAHGVSTPSETPLITPIMFQSMIPMLPQSFITTSKCRADVDMVLQGVSDKLVVVVGPCSIHDPTTAIEYAKLLVELNQDPLINSNLVVIMRAYLEKPRTTVGWKGILNDPDLDGSFNISKGLFVSRQMFSDITAMGIPIATELLGIISPQYMGEFLSLGAVGARTTESQVHRELVSGLTFPVGFKNGTDGGSTVALDAIESSASPHYFPSISGTGNATIVGTHGNKSTFLILRGGGGKTNYDSVSVKKSKAALKARGMGENVMVDCSHGNSEKNHNNQPKVAAAIAEQIRNGERGIIGCMIESNLVAGAQSLPKLGRYNLTRGQSITDACIDWPTTVDTLTSLAEAVKARRALSSLE